MVGVYLLAPFVVLGVGLGSTLLDVKCENCNNEATVHDLSIRNGVKVERHLCERCAGETGIAAQPQQALSELIKQFSPTTTGSVGAIVSQTPPKGTMCPACRLTYAEFKQHGLLGCPECYRAFETQLASLLERAHEGGSQHVGKRPKRLTGKSEGAAGEGSADPRKRALLLAALRQKLEAAVQTEQYERAAKLRDQMRNLADPSHPEEA